MYGHIINLAKGTAWYVVREWTWMCIYTITWLQCAFSLVTADVQFTPYPRQRTCLTFFMPPNPSINHLSFYCIKQIDYIFPCVYCNRPQKTSQRVKNNSQATSLQAVTSSVVYYSTHTRKNVIYLSNNELCYFICRGQILPVHMLSNTESVELIYENDKYCVQVK